MKTSNLISTQVMLRLVMATAVAQEQLIEAQQQLVAAQKEIIKLQRKIERMTPKNLPSEDRWHIKTDTFSWDAATSDDLTVVEAYNEWINWFGKKHLKPYLNAATYGECLGHMSRGLPQQLAKLQTERDAKRIFEAMGLQAESNKPILKLPVMQDA